MSSKDIRVILKQLSAGSAEAGWKAFLAGWSDLIYTVVLRYEHDEQRVQDCYLFVCGGLSDDGFARLLRFNPDGSASFSTWLATVAGRMCVDWHRSEYGRFREFDVVQRLPDLERRLFRFRFEHGMTLQECQHALQTEFTQVSTKELHAAHARLNAALSSEQHWRLAVRQRPVTESELPARQFIEYSQDMAHPSVGPEGLAETDEKSRDVRRALSELAERDQLLLQLRYRHGLTLEQIARISGASDLQRARRELARALNALKASLSR